MARIRILYLIVIFCIDTTRSVPLETSTQNPTDSPQPLEIRSDKSNTKVSDHKTLEELVKQQTETVKKIVAEQKQQPRPDYPVVTKLEPHYKDEIKRELEKMSLDELKIKCQHLSKLLGSNKTIEESKSADPNIIPTSSTRRVNSKPSDLHSRPVYVQPKTTTVKTTTIKPTTSKPMGFYITSQSSTMKKPDVKTQPPVKFIRLEPVILQKTILNDGRVVYYWHRSLPTAVEFNKGATQRPPIAMDYSYTPYNNYLPAIPQDYGNAPPYGYPALPPNSYIPPIPNSYIPPYRNILYSSTPAPGITTDKSSTETTQVSTTSTTEQPSYGYGFGSFLPFYGPSRQESTTTTTTEPTTTTTTTTTPKPPMEKLKTEDLFYAQQLRFVIPVPYENSGAVRRPWDFDRYAYYPKELQPKTVKVEVPYTPTFHMITAVAVPNSEGGLNENTHLKN